MEKPGKNPGAFNLRKSRTGKPSPRRKPYDRMERHAVSFTLFPD